MKWLLIFSFPLSPPPAGGDRWFSVDKWKHFAACAVVQSVGYGVARGGQGHSASLRVGAAAAAIVGVGKELVDERRRNAFSVKDLVWDGAGAGAAAAAIHATR